MPPQVASVDLTLVDEGAAEEVLVLEARTLELEARVLVVRTLLEVRTLETRVLEARTVLETRVLDETRTELDPATELVHFPKRVLQPVPQWPVDEPHHPYCEQHSPSLNPVQVKPLVPPQEPSVEVTPLGVEEATVLEGRTLDEEDRTVDEATGVEDAALVDDDEDRTLDETTALEEAATLEDAALVDEEEDRTLDDAAALEDAALVDDDEEEAEFVHFPKRGLQAAPQWSTDVPHQPYLLMLEHKSKGRGLDLLRAAFAFAEANARITVSSSARAICGSDTAGGRRRSAGRAGSPGRRDRRRSSR